MYILRSVCKVVCAVAGSLHDECETNIKLKHFIFSRYFPYYVCSIAQTYWYTLYWLQLLIYHSYIENTYAYRKCRTVGASSGRVEFHHIKFKYPHCDLYYSFHVYVFFFLYLRRACGIASSGVYHIEYRKYIEMPIFTLT